MADNDFITKKKLIWWKQKYIKMCTTQEVYTVYYCGTHTKNITNKKNEENQWTFLFTVVFVNLPFNLFVFYLTCQKDIWFELHNL